MNRAMPAAPRRLLLIAPYYPPGRAVGALRPASFARHLREHGWQTTVVTMRATQGAGEPGATATADIVHATRGFDTADTLAIRGRYPGMLAVPDRYVSWLPFAVHRALRIARAQRIDAVLSTSPPVTAQCVGLILKKSLRVPWVADLRDPWRTAPSASRVAGAADAWLERAVLRAADAVTAASDGIGAALERRCGPLVAGKLDIITNGFEEDEFAAPRPRALESQGFTIAHVGALAGYRDPRTFLESIRLCLDRKILPAGTTVRFVGSSPPRAQDSLRAAVEACGLGGVVRIETAVPYARAVACMLDADLLLVLQTSLEVAVCVPTKAYDYLRSGKHILCVADEGSEARRFLNGFAGVFTAGPSDPEAIAQQTALAYRAWRDGPPPSRELSTYSRRATAAQLARTLDRICAAAGSGRA